MIFNRLAAGGVVMTVRVCVFRLACALAMLGVALPVSAQNSRAKRGLQVLYDFRSTQGTVVKDRAGVGQPVDLWISNLKAVRRFNGSLTVREATLIQSGNSSKRLSDAIRKTGEISIETWIRPANTDLTGPARIVTFSRGSSERNFTLGQDKDLFEVRLRTSRTSKNGIPSMSSTRRSLQTKLMHFVYTRDRAGRTQITINGKRNASKKISGTMSNWNGGYKFALANELSNDRPWQGTYYLVAVYNRALSANEIQQNYKIGAGAQAALATAAERKAAINSRLFVKQVVPLLAQRCLECHGWKSTKGKLDLSRKFTALRGGESGPPIVPGKATASLLWKSVDSHDMPKNRPPLSAREKSLLRVWINDGAQWSLENIPRSKYEVTQKKGSNWLRRLTVTEYIETVRVTVGVDVAKEARKILPRDLRADGFSNTAYNLGVDLEHIQAYGKLAQMIVAKMDVEKFAAKYTGSREKTNANFRKLIQGMGAWLLRGPLAEREVAEYLRVTSAVLKEGGDFKESVSYLLEAMLISPRFIYRIEMQRGDGKPRPVGNFELASRLSYIVWGGPPDAELLRAAREGELAIRSNVELQVRRMLKDPRAVTRSSWFLHEWLNLDRLQNLRPNTKRFPKWDNRLAVDMQEETQAFFKEVAWKQKRPLADLLSAQFTYATPQLAKHYGLKPKSGTGLQKYDLSNVSSRGGLLTQGSVLTIGGDEASMVTRGLFVLHDILNGKVDDPPPGLDTTPVPSKPGLSQRGIALVRIANQSCGGCHSRFEPFAFGLEKFDGLGGYQKTDHHGNKLRDDGEILFPGQNNPVAYKTSAELMSLLSKSNRVQQTLNRKVTQWALGRPLQKEDETDLQKIHQQAQKNGNTYTSLITAIVLSDLVRTTRTEQQVISPIGTKPEKPKS